MSENLTIGFIGNPNSAKEWNILPDSVGIMGSSAGGHLASTVATHAPAKLRPAFQILFYPVITMGGQNVHQGSKKHLLGENPNSKLVKKYSNEWQVNKKTPCAFIALSGDDQSVKPVHSVNYHKALITQKIPSEIHIYANGRSSYLERLQKLFHMFLYILIRYFSQSSFWH